MYTPTLNTTRYAVPDVGQLNALRHKSGYLHTVTPMCPSPREWSTPSQTKPTRQISFTRLSSFSTQNANCCVSSLGDLPSSRIDALFSWYSRSKPWFSTFFMQEMLTARSMRSLVSHVCRLTLCSISFASREFTGKTYWQSVTELSSIWFKLIVESNTELKWFCFTSLFYFPK